MTATPITAFILLVGNELLTGKIDDLNGIRAARALRQHGISVVGMEIVPDAIDRIVGSIRRIRAELAPTLLITSGGLGPTHDDLTIAAVAQALDRPLDRHAEFENIIRHHYGARTTDAVLGMADLPRGCELIFRDGTFFPLFKLEEIYCMPGEPNFFGLKLATLLDTLKPAGKFFTARLFLNCEEAGIAAPLDAVQAEFPEVPIGSYPRYDGGDRQWWTLITVDGTDAARVNAVVERLKETLPAGTITQIETD